MSLDVQVRDGRASQTFRQFDLGEYERFKAWKKIQWAHGVWSDIDEMDVLEGWGRGREEGDEKHVCPLQLSLIQRCIRLYSNPGDLILDPFMGVGSTAWVALGGKARDGVLHAPRRACGFELKESYHRQAVRAATLALSGQGHGLGL